MLLALWWYFWQLTPAPAGPDSVTVVSQHFVVALALMHAFAPPTASSHRMVAVGDRAAHVRIVLVDNQRMIASADVADRLTPGAGGVATEPGTSSPFTQPGFFQPGFGQ